MVFVGAIHVQFQEIEAINRRIVEFLASIGAVFESRNCLNHLVIPFRECIASPLPVNSGDAFFASFGIDPSDANLSE